MICLNLNLQLIPERDERYWKWKEAVKRSCGWEVHPDQMKAAGDHEHNNENHKD